MSQCLSEIQFFQLSNNKVGHSFLNAGMDVCECYNGNFYFVWELENKELMKRAEYRESTGLCSWLLGGRNWRSWRLNRETKTSLVYMLHEIMSKEQRKNK